MLKNFLKIAYRNLFRYKFYSIINILSLSIGLSVFLLAYLYAHINLSFDKFHHNSENIYRVTTIYEKDSTLNKYATTPFPLAKSIIKEYPKYIKSYVRIFNFQKDFHLVEYNEKRYNEKNFFYADKNILDVFDFEFIEGKKNKVFNSDYSVIISQSAKKKYFGKYSPIGKEIIVEKGFIYKITGVFKDFPNQSHVHFDFITPMTSLNKIMGKAPQTWHWNACWTYILLKSKIKEKEFIKKLPVFVNKYFSKDIKKFSSLHLQKISDIHLKSDLEFELEENNRAIYIYVIFATSFFLLLIAIINFINLSIVGSIARIKEIGLRKVFGSSKKQLILLFSVEAFILSFFALFIALFFVEISIPILGKVIGCNLNGNIIFKYNAFNISLAIVFVTSTIVGVNTGIYTYSFSFNCTNKAKTKMGSLKWTSGKLLILLQYTISLILLILVLINFKQLLFLKKSDLGFNDKNILILNVGNTQIKNEYEKVKKLLLKSKNIESVTAMDNIIGTKSTNRRYFYYNNNIKKVQFFPEITVKEDFFKTFNINVLVGDILKQNKSYKSDSLQKEYVIINKTLANSLNYKNLDNIINKKLFRFQKKERVSAVINDFNTNSLHRPLSPLVIRIENNKFDAIEKTKYIAIKLKNNFSKEDLNYIYKLWVKFTDNKPFEFKYLEEMLILQYKNEDLLNFFLWIQALLIVLISGMGIWAVTYFLSIQRTKEIGIRKAIGASTSDIIYLFSKDFIKMLAISNIFAWPIAYFLIYKWLGIFAYRVDIELYIFFSASVLMMLFTLLIVWFQAFKVAIANPVKALRDE